MMKVTSIIGGRPHLIKCEPVHRALRSSKLSHELIDCSYPISDYLEFERGNFDLPTPVAELEAISPDSLVPSLYDALERSKTNLVILYGDLDASMAGAIAACRLGVPIMHIESGFRSGDLADSEERNRIVIDRCAALRIAFSELMRRNLLSENLPEDSIHVFENPSVATLRNRVADLDIVTPRDAEIRVGFVRVHREENLQPKPLKQIVDQVADLTRYYSIRFVMFERTRQALCDAFLLERLRSIPNVVIVGTLDYATYVRELMLASFVVTDSSGLQDDAVFLTKPCFVLRRSTPRVDGLIRGNVLVSNLAEVQLSSLVRNHLNVSSDRKGRGIEGIQAPPYDSRFVDMVMRVITAG